MTTITKSHITAQPAKFGDPMPQVIVELSDGTKDVKLFDYYPDELSFTAEEFLGLTKQEAYALFAKKDREYINS